MSRRKGRIRRYDEVTKGDAGEEQAETGGMKG
jgi:hypothetical protein